MECLQNAQFRCTRCGVKHRSFSFNREGEIYIVYLVAAHVFENEKMLEDAYLVCLCVRCHYYFDHPRNNDLPDEGIADWTFIGLVAKRIIEEESYAQEPLRQNSYAG